MSLAPWSGLRLDRPTPHQSQPVKWWLLISAMEDFSSHTGMGLASVWGHVHRGDYEAANEAFCQIADDWNNYLTRTKETR